MEEPSLTYPRRCEASFHERFHRVQDAFAFLATVEQTGMIYFLLFCVLSMAATAESAISNSSVQATTTSGGATTLDWVKITAVPLGVFLLGACIWGIVVDTTARWNRSFNARGEPHEAHEVLAHGQVNNGFNARDLEEGLELSHRGTEDDLAMAPNPPVVPDRMQSELESAHSTET